MSMGCNNDLCFEKIYFSYNDNHNKKKICQNFNLNIKNGIFTSIIGPSGSGKTSLLKMIAGLIGYCLLYTSPSPRDKRQSRMPSSA